MMFVKKPKHDISLKAVDEVVHSYFTYLSECKVPLTYMDISELLRYSVCVSLGLLTSKSTKKIDELSDDIISIIKPILVAQNVADRDIEYKQSFLEACVHCMEFSRKRLSNERTTDIYEYRQQEGV
jgi:hypothetical protein